MIEFIFNKIIEYCPQVSAYAAIIMIVGLLTWKACSFYQKTNSVCSKIPNMEKLLLKIDRGLSALNGILIEKNIIIRSCYSDTNSPRIINDLGKMVCQESGAEKLFEKIKNNLVEELLKKQSDSSLEVEQNALLVLLEKKNDPEFKEVQKFVYNNQTYHGKDLAYVDILHVMSLMLRDYYFESTDSTAKASQKIIAPQ